MIDSIYKAIEEAEEFGLMTKASTDVLSGFSGNKLVGALQRISYLFADRPENIYLEVGVFQGLTLLSTAFANPHMRCFGIDNFAYFDSAGKNQAIVEKRRSALSLSNAFLINSDYEDALSTLSSKIGEAKVGVYFVDGPHDYRSQRVCLDLVLPFLDNHAVILVDDCNYAHVRQANSDFLRINPEFKLIYEAYTPCHPDNMNDTTKKAAQNGWWNGVNIIVRDVTNCLPVMLPPTVRDRLLYENDHKLHSSKLSAYLPELVARSISYIDASTLNKPKQAALLLRWLLRLKGKIPPEEFNQANTWSRGLVASRFNPGVKRLP